MANFFAQTEALAFGLEPDSVRRQLEAADGELAQQEDRLAALGARTLRYDRHRRRLGMLFAGMTAFVAWRHVLPDPAVPDSLRRLAPFVLAPAFFVITTAALVRAVHHLAGVAWSFEALFESVRVQATLSIYWGLLGFVCMIGGARKSRRALWLAGAGFMAVVVVKLFLVDLGNSGTVERIVSFIGTVAFAHYLNARRTT